jgi:5'-nucleotidase
VPGGDIAINNNMGGIRADLPLGPVTYGAVFEAMPFDNRVVAFRLTGATLRKLVAAWAGTPVPAFPGLAGLRARVTCRGTVLDVALLRPDGTPVRDDDQVQVVTVDFVATGGDRIFESIMPPGGFEIERDGGTARDAVVEALRKRGGILRADDLIDPANPRWALPGPRPVSCAG